MTVPQKVMLDIFEHEKSGTPLCFEQVFDKWRGHYAYDEFREICLEFGHQIPYNHDTLIKQSRQGEKSIWTREIQGLEYAKKRKEFTMSDFRQYFDRLTDSCVNHNAIIRQLIGGKHIERIGNGRYRSNVAA